MHQLATYEVISVDLSVANPALEIVRANNRIRMVYLNDVTAGGLVSIKIGSTGQAMQMKENRPIRFRVRPFDGAIVIFNPNAQAAKVAEIIVVYDDGTNNAEPFTLGNA